MKCAGSTKKAALLLCWKRCDPQSVFSPSTGTRKPALGWGHLRTLVIESPTKLLSIAPFVSTNDFGPDGAWRYLDGYVELSRAGKAFAWDPLLDLADRTVDELKQRSNWEDANWLGTLARLLEAGILSANRIPDDELTRVFGILEALIERFATPVSGPDQADDLQIHQLNSVAGIASEALALMAWRCLDETAPGALREDLRERLLLRLDRAAEGEWGGQEMIFALGRNLPVLQRLRAGWMDSGDRRPLRHPR